MIFENVLGETYSLLLLLMQQIENEWPVVHIQQVLASQQV